MEPLAKLHSLRNLKGHGSTHERKAALKQARSEHRTLRAHYTDLATECDKSLGTILNTFGIAMDLDLPSSPSTLA